MQSPPQISHRHHYAPQFYLRAWQNAEKTGVWVYKRNKKNQITFRTRSPKSIGYLNDLYSLKPETTYSILNPIPDSIEKYFSYIDAAAAIVHKKLLSSGICSLTKDDKLNWSLFLNSLMERNPKRIRDIEKGLSDDEMKNEFLTSHGRKEFKANCDWDSLRHNAIRTALVDFTSDKAFIDYIAEMRWATVDISISDEHLLTSDTPLLINGGSASMPVQLLSIALAPHRLLTIYADAEEFDENFIRTLALMHNITIIEHTERYLISSRRLEDGPHTKFSRCIERLR